jgi:hypothetical protein
MSLRRNAAFLLALSSMPAYGFAGESAQHEPPCIQSDMFWPDATLDLKRAYQDSKHAWIGEFEFVNYNLKPGFPIYLNRENGQAFADLWPTQIEFRNLYGLWTVLDDFRPPGTFIPDPKNIVVVKPGKRLTFHYRLFPEGVLKYGGMEFQLMLYAEERGLCIVSFPFQSVPTPLLPTGLRALPHAPPSTVTDPAPVLKKCHKSKIPPHPC